jgi:hypothetical protein
VEPSYYGHPQLTPPVRWSWNGEAGWDEGVAAPGAATNVDLSEQRFLRPPNTKPGKDDACLC